MAQPMCFNIGDKVRITGGIYTVTYPDKRIVYDMKGRAGVIVSRSSFSRYKVEVEIDGMKRQIMVPETGLTLQRIDTPLQDRIEKILKVAPVKDPSDLIKRLNEIGEALVNRALDEMKVREKMIVEPIGLCLDSEHLGKIVFKKKESKMTKERCIKLLESYRAERDKVQKGRKFERCLRFDVVNDALEKAIELLKGGAA